MAERLSPLDLSLLYAERPTTPMHGGGLAILDQPEPGMDYGRFADLIARRIALAPRYRQKPKSVPGRLSGPVWVDDVEFDLTYHLRRVALPTPGEDRQLRQLLARVQAQTLDRRRPLWEMYLVEGLQHDRFAIITKTHYAMVDGVTGIDINQVILDRSPSGPDTEPEQTWTPEADPPGLVLIAQAIADAARRPGSLVDIAKLRAGGAAAAPAKAMEVVTGLLAAARFVARPAPGSPLNAAIGRQRRFATVDTRLEQYRAIRQRRGGTVNDVVLAVVTGAIRGWMLSRKVAVTPATVVRALAPLSSRGLDDPQADVSEATMPAGIVPYLIDLPVGEPNPAVRLTQISYAMRAHQESGQSVSADRLAALSGFAPPTLHALGARAANGMARRLFNVVVSNVPGSQQPLYVNGARMRTLYPVVPLASGQSLAIGVTSYNGGLYYGLNGDRDTMRDIDVIAAMISESLEELLSSA